MASHLVGSLAPNLFQIEPGSGHHAVGLGERLSAGSSEEIGAGFGMDRNELTGMLRFELAP